MNIKTDDLAIISMACRLPDAENISELWKNLARGTSAIKPIPAERWRMEGFFHKSFARVGKSNTRLGAFVDKVKDFDPQFFNINPADACVMDPQQRILIELAYETIMSTQYSTKELAGKKIGVFLGITKSDYKDFVQTALIKQQLKQNTVVIGVLENLIAARISNLFDFQGPSLTIDTACSSSLVALHIACESILCGSSEMALVGGINLNLVPAPYLGMSAAGALSPGEKYFVFDRRAYGFFMGEGGGLVLVKKLSKAIEDKDQILGVIKGSAVNNDGRSISPMAPRPLTQQNVLREAYEKACISPEEVDYIEAHGTGTALGDAIEAQTLVNVFKNSERKKYLGSIKPNIGHLLSGAGIAGLIKVLLIFHHHRIPSLLNYEQPRSDLQLEDSGFILNPETETINSDKPLIAGINGFGFGGTNAHVILQEYCSKTPKAPFKQFEPDYNRKEYWLDIDFSMDRQVGQFLPEEKVIKAYRSAWKEAASNTQEVAASPTRTGNSLQLPFSDTSSDTSIFRPPVVICPKIYHDFSKKLFQATPAEQLKAELFSEADKTELVILFPVSYKSLFNTLKEIISCRDKINHLTVITEQAVVLPDEEPSANRNKLVTAGLAYLAASELNFSVKHLDLDKNEAEELKINQIKNESGSESGQVVFRNGKRFKKSFEPFNITTSRGYEKVLKDDGVYLITGGASGIGLSTAEFLAAKHPASFILVGRRPEAEIKGWQKIKKELQGFGARVSYYSVDISQEEEVNMLFGIISSEHSRLDGIIHAAGTVNPGLLSDKEFSVFETTLEPKVKGVNLLAEMVDNYNFSPDFFIVFSSMSSLFPAFSRGIADYAVANYYLDQFALLKNNQGKSIQVINWGPWQDFGMAAEHPLMLKQLAEKGIKAIETETGLQIIEQVIKNKYSETIFINSDIALESFLGNKTVKEPVRVIQQSPHISNETYQPEADLQQKIIAVIREELASPDTSIGVDDNLLDIGIDSLSAMEVIAKLGKMGYKNLPFELLFENQTVRDIAAYLYKSGNKTGKPVVKIPSMYRLSKQQEAFYKASVISDIPNYSFFRQTINQPLNPELLEKSLNMLIAGHPLLRVNFFSERKENSVNLAQKIAHQKTLKIKVLSPDQPLEQLENSFVNKVFELDKDLLLRAALVLEDTQSHLLIMAHHIIFDGVSMLILVKELWEIYSTLISGKPYTPENLQGSYFDYIDLINGLKNNGKAESSLGWWKNEINSFRPFENYEIKKLNHFSFSATEAFKFSFPAEFSRKINETARKNNITSQFLLLTAYGNAVIEFFKLNTVTVNLAVSGRQHKIPDIGRIIGCFADTFPVIIEKNVNIINQSGQLRDKWNQGKKFHYLSSNEILNMLKEKELSFSPFSFSFVSFNNSWAGELPFTITDTNTRGFNINTRFAVQMWEGFNGFNYTLNCPAGYFTREEAEQFNRLFLKNVISAVGINEKHQGSIVENKVTKISEKVNTLKEAPQNSLIIDKFRYVCTKYPEKTAIGFKEQNTSYQELNEKSDNLAGFLQISGVGEGSVIAVIGTSSVNTVITLLAILKLGAVYVPVEADYPLYRVQDMLNISKACFVVQVEEHPDIQKIKGKEVFSYSEIQKGEYSFNYQPCIYDKSTAYIIFTSGSTGKPKGVPISYKSLETYLEWCISEFNYNQEDVFIQTASICFDASLRQILAPLITGALLCPLSQEEKLDIKLIWQIIQDKKITIWSSVPSLWEKLLVYAEKKQDKNLSALRMVKVGGEALNPALVRRWQKIYGNLQKIVNLYGPTEATINAAFYVINGLLPENLTNIPIGRLLPYFRAALIQPGDRGELCIAGEGLTPGYLNEDEANEKKFYHDEKGERFYKTGDLVSQDEAGNYLFHGRTDRQIKIRGFRIEPEEIEQILTEHPLVISAAVEYFQESKKLIAVVTLRYSYINENDLKEYLVKELPAYFVPHKIGIVQDFPLLPNGKTDRKRLFSIYRQEAVDKSADVSNLGNTTGEIIKGIWKKLLKTSEVEPDSDFFEEGGDSLLLMQLFMDLEEHFTKLPKIAAFYKKAKFSNLVALISQTEDTEGPEKPLTSDLLHITKFPLSPAQMGFYLTGKFLGKDESYWYSEIILNGDIQPEIFRKALEIIHNRHEMLQARLVTENPPYWEITKNSVLPFSFSETPSPMEHIDLNAGYPLIRHRLERSGNNNFTWKIKASHILADGLSCIIFQDELLQVYNDLIENKEPELLLLTSRFSDFTVYLQENSKKNAYKDHLYWLNIFKKPYTEPVLNNYEVQDKEIFFNFRNYLSNLEVAEVEKLAEKSGFTPFIIFLNSFYEALSELIGQNDLVIGLAHHGRDYPVKGINNIFGCFARALPLRINKAETLTEQLQQIKYGFSEAMAFALDPVEIIKRMTPGTKLRSLLGNQFFISMIDMSAQNREYKNISVDWEKSYSSFKPGNNDNAVFLSIKKLPGKTEIHFSVNKQNFSIDEAEKLVKIFSQKVRNLFTKKVEIVKEPLQLTGSLKPFSALIGYLPSVNNQMVNREIAENLKKMIFADKKAIWYETIQTAFGNTATIMLPFFAEEITPSNRELVKLHIAEALVLAKESGVNNISLAGMIPSVTGFGVMSEQHGLKITTGHSTTVSAVITTLKKAIDEFKINLTEKTVAFVGLGSIGKAALFTMLANMGHPHTVILSDLYSSENTLKETEKILYETFGYCGKVLFALNDSKTDNKLYWADIIVTAASKANVIDVEKLKPGTILIDDSFPYAFDTAKAVKRMEEKADILVTGGGLLNIPVINRKIYFPVENPLIANLLITSYLPDTMASCQAEALLMALNPALHVTQGLADYRQISQYLTFMEEREISCAPFHVGKYVIRKELLNIIIKSIQTLRVK